MVVSTFLPLAIFSFFLGATIIGIIWYVLALLRRSRQKGTSVVTDSNLAEVARMLRDKQTNDLVIGINGNTYRSVHELNPGQTRRLNFASNVLAKWLVEPAPAPTSAEAPATLEATSVEEPGTPISAFADEPNFPVSTPADEVTAPISMPAEETSPLPPEAATERNEWIPTEITSEDISNGHIPPFMSDFGAVKPVSTELPDIVGEILTPTPQPAPEFKSIAMQINDILQAKMVGTSFETRGISVNDAPDHGVLVTLDGEKYPGVKDVPDEEVRTLIRAAVVEWEKQGKPFSK